MWLILLILAGLFYGGEYGFKYGFKLRAVIAQTRRRQTEIVPCSPDDVPGLDAEKLEAATRELRSLGFDWLEDHMSRPVTPPQGSPWATAPIADPQAAPPQRDAFVPQGLARVMTHPEHGCLAKIMAISVVKTANNSVANTSFSVALVSAAGSGAESWQYSTSNREADATNDALMMLTRRPRYLSTRIPGVSIEETMQKHLARRVEIARALDLSWNRSATLADDYDSERRASDNIRLVYNRLNPLFMAWQIFRNKRAPLARRLEWLGELQGKI